MNPHDGQGKMGVILHLKVWKRQFSQPPPKSAQIPPVWGSAHRAQKHFPYGYLSLHPWMDSQFADGLRAFPVNNTFLSRAISTPNESHWPQPPFPFPCYSLLVLGHLEASKIFNAIHTVAQKLHIQSSRSSEFKGPIKIVYPMYLNREISIKVFGYP